MTNGQVQVQLTGYTTTRSLKSADVVFTAAAGATLDKSSFPGIPLDTAAAYFATDASIATGGQFTLTSPFSLQGDAASVDSVAVTLTNSAGNSVSMQGKRCP